MAKESAEEKLLKMMQKSGAPVTPKTASPAAASQKTAKKFEFSFTIGHLNQILLLGIVACVIDKADDASNDPEEKDLI